MTIDDVRALRVEVLRRARSLAPEIGPDVLAARMRCLRPPLPRRRDPGGPLLPCPRLPRSARGPAPQAGRGDALGSTATEPDDDRAGGRGR